MARNVLLMTHLQPVIHGQAMMANLLLDESKAWPECQLIGINAAYEENRAKLRGFSWNKIERLWGFLLDAADQVKMHGADRMITTMAFFPGPFLKDCLIVFFARWVLRCRVIVWVHMDPNRLSLEQKPFWFRWLAKRMVSSIDAWVACAPSLSDTWPQWMKSKPISEIANGIPDHSMRSLPATKSRRTVLFISVIDREKGWRELFDAACLICKELDDVDFVFRGGIGINECAEEVTMMFAASSAPDRIHYDGPVWGEEKSDLLQKADLFCLPSHTEAFPLAILEAMSYALPVVATDVGAVKQAVRPDEEAWFCKADHPESLLNALRTALRNPSEMQRRGEAARRRFESLFTNRVFGEQWRQLLNNSTNLT